MGLGELIYSDLFVDENPRKSWYKPTPDSLSVVAVPENCHTELDQLRQHLLSHNDLDDFSVRWPLDTKDSVRLRVARQVDVNDELIFVCRRYSLPPGELMSLGVPIGTAKKLMGSELSSGLVVFFGKAGSGKSTAAASFVSERLATFGGVCWTIENPAELRLQGQHGKGRCYQTQVKHDSEIGPAIQRLMRSTPNIILIGELRDGRAVAEAITAALSGHLVVTTFHAGDLISGIGRLAGLAQSINKDMGHLLADAFKVGLHLTLNILDPEARRAEPEVKAQGTPPRVLEVEQLWLTGQVGDAPRTMIRDGAFQQLSSEINRQKSGFMMHGILQGRK